MWKLGTQPTPSLRLKREIALDLTISRDVVGTDTLLLDANIPTDWGFNLTPKQGQYIAVFRHAIWILPYVNDKQNSLPLFFCPS